MLDRLLRARWLHLPLVLAVCAAIVLPGLASTGLSLTEGHRVLPGWGMLETGDWWRQELFGATYVRKPPGMPWAVAASAAVLGESEWSARLVSAVCAMAMAAAAWAFSTRWFGRPWGLAAGLAQALMPALWLPGRSAEIESLNHLGTQLAALAMCGLLASPRGGSGGAAPPVVRWVGLGLAAGAGIIVLAAAKGPAAAPVVAAVLVAGLVVSRRDAARQWPGVVLAAAVAAGVLWPLAQRFSAANADPQAIRQGVSDFLWSSATAGRTVLLPLTALGMAMPLGLLLWTPWAQSAAEEGEWGRCVRVARTLVLAAAGSVLVFVAAGVSNPRYLLPVLVLLPPLAAFAARGAARGGEFSFGVRTTVKRLSLGWPAAWVVVLLIAAAIYVPLTDASRGRNSGRESGIELGRAVPAGVAVWADALVESRPEVLWYMQRRAAQDGKGVRPLWRKHEIERGEIPAAGDCIVLCHAEDGSGLEGPRSRELVGAGRLRPIATSRTHKFWYTLYRVAPE